MQAQVFRVPMASPDDISGVVELIDSGWCGAEDVVCIMGKTEGNGCVNDFARGFSNFVLADYFGRCLGISREETGERIALIMSGGTEGVMGGGGGGGGGATAKNAWPWPPGIRAISSRRRWAAWRRCARRPPWCAA